jgi:hypothetical protein
VDAEELLKKFLKEEVVPLVVLLEDTLEVILVE